MRKLILLLAAALLLATPVRASEGPDSRSPDPDGCAHSFADTVVVRANCSQPGLTAYTCSLCGFTYTEQTPVNGEHDYVLMDTSVSCTEPGTAYYTCSLCGDAYTEPIPAAGHTPDREAPGCTDGVRCTVCGELLERALGHDYAYQFDAQPDGEGGFVSYGTWRCANCGDVLAATRGNAVYYSAGETAFSEGTVPSEGAYDDASPTDGTASDGEQRGLWLAISAGVLAFVVIEAVLLVRSLRKDKTTV